MGPRLSGRPTKIYFWRLAVPAACSSAAGGGTRRQTRPHSSRPPAVGTNTSITRFVQSVESVANETAGKVGCMHMLSHDLHKLSVSIIDGLILEHNYLNIYNSQ
jgi:hypothetical protein